MKKMKIISKEKRITHLKDIQLQDNKKESYRLSFRGEHINLPIYKVSRDFPLYRLKNGRTLAKQEEYVKRRNKQSDFLKITNLKMLKMLNTLF